MTLRQLEPGGHRFGVDDGTVGSNDAEMEADVTIDADIDANDDDWLVAIGVEVVGVDDITVGAAEVGVEPGVEGLDTSLDERDADEVGKLMSSACSDVTRIVVVTSMYDVVS